MSLNRLVARLAVVSALNNFMKQPWPTLAGPHIFDSKIEPIEDMKHDRAFPCCVVYTDYDKDHWAKSGKIHADRLMTVTLELLVVQAEKEKDAEVYKLECPMTDSEIETTLDIFETQIFRALTSGTTASDAFNYICPAYVNAISRRGASMEGGLRLAARQITIEMKAVRDNTAGVIPSELEPFLAELAQHSDYSDRVMDIRAAYTAPSAGTEYEIKMRTLGYTRNLANMLGTPSGQLSLLPPELTFIPRGFG